MKNIVSITFLKIVGFFGHFKMSSIFRNFMEVFGTQKNAFKYSCIFCHYHTSKTSSYKQHLLSAKHQAAENIQFVPKLDLTPQPMSTKYACVSCGHQYSSKSGLWKHSARCKEKINILPNNTKQLTELVMKLIDQNQELSKQLVELSKNSKPCTTNNTTNNVNNNNNSFNLNFYLNDTCKDAININEFVDSLVLSVNDLEETARIGYANGISKIFINGLQKLDVSKRPLHCSDFKRNTLYVKNENQWIKESDEKPILTKAIKQVANKNIKNIFEWQKSNPEYNDPDSKQNDRYNKIICESMSGSTKEEQLKNYEKIVNNVVKEVVIEKV